MTQYIFPLPPAFTIFSFQHRCFQSEPSFRRMQAHTLGCVLDNADRVQNDAVPLSEFIENTRSFPVLQVRTKEFPALLRQISFSEKYPGKVK